MNGLRRQISSGHLLVQAARLAPMIRAWFYHRVDMLAQLFLVILAGFARIWRLAQPNAQVFDEIYFPVFAGNYLDGVSFFDAHPPLGKYLIAAGIRFFGDNTVGHRAVEVLFGIAVIILIYRLAAVLFDSRRVAFLAGLLASLDGLLLVESRTGMINIFAIFFSLASYHYLLTAGSERATKPPWTYLVAAGACIGAAAAVKWIGAASLGVVFVAYGFARWSGGRRFSSGQPPALLRGLSEVRPWMFLLCFVALPVVVYSASFYFHLAQIPDYSFVELHKQMFGYHAHLQASHSYASPWWSWPLSTRPVSYFHHVDQQTETVRTILNIGNPVIWWLAIPAALYGVWVAFRRAHLGAGFALLAIGMHYLPFAIISRVTFSYHFMGALPFTIMLLAYSLDRLWQAGHWQRELAFAAIIAIILTAVYFYPIWTAYPIPVGAYYQRMWLASWI